MAQYMYNYKFYCQKIVTVFDREQKARMRKKEEERERERLKERRETDLMMEVIFLVRRLDSPNTSYEKKYFNSFII